MSIAAIKSLGWSHQSIKGSTFKGVIQTFEGDKGTVAVAFNLHEAFIVEDADGLFGLEDLKDGVVKDNDVDIFTVATINGATIIAFESNNSVSYDEDKLTALGINDFEVKESLKKRLLTLSMVDVYDEMGPQ